MGRREGEAIVTTDAARQQLSARPTAETIWDDAHRGLSVGLILAMTITAFQGMAMSTVAPIVADEIGARSLYGWIFSGFLLAQIVGTVFAGREVDRRSPAAVLLPALVLFGIGCLIAGAAPSIHVLVLGRAVQGFGAGALGSCVYAVVAAAYSDRLRPSMLAALSSAWIVPSLIGPAIAGFVAESFSWRYVFFGLLPILLVVAPLTLPTFRRIPASRPDAAPDNRLLLAIALALATGVFLAGLELRPWWIGMVVAAVGLVAMAPTLQRSLPAGCFTVRPVMPAAIVTRGLGFGGFAVVETYLVFALKDFGGVSATEAGLVLTITALLWSTGSWIQARWDRASDGAQRTARIVTGFGLVGAGSIALLLSIAVWQVIPLWLAIVAWAIAGFGIGLGYPTTVTVAFAHTPEGENGLVSSSLMLADLFAFSVGVGLGGVLLAVAESADWSTPAATALAMSLGVVLVAGSIVAGARTRASGGFQPS
jgi:MFS family permease